MSERGGGRAVTRKRRTRVREPFGSIGRTGAPIWMLLAAALALYLSFFNAFTVPNTLFFAFHNEAIGFLQGLPPENFDYPPLFPFLIGVTSLIVPGSTPTLLAAELINVVLSGVCLWAIYRIARRFLGPRGSLAITALCAVNRTMVYCAVQPLAEMALLTAILLTVLLALQKSAWAYVAALVATLLRYEGVALLLSLVLQDAALRVRTNVWTRVALAAAASAGVVTWAVLTWQHDGVINAYLVDFLKHWQQRGLSSFLEGSMRILIDFLPGFEPSADFHRDAIGRLLLLPELALLFTGVVVLIRRYRASAIVMVVYLLGFLTALSGMFGFWSRRVVPILWLLYLVMAIGLKALIGTAQRTLAARIPSWMAACGCAILWGGVGVVAWQMLRQDPIRLPAFALCGLSVRSCWMETARHGSRRPSAASRVAPIALCLILGLGIRSSSQAMLADNIRLNRAQFKAVAAWYQKTAQSGDKMLITLPWVVGYYSELPAGYFVPTGRLRSSSVDGLLKELQDRGVTYLVWESDYWRDEPHWGRFFQVPRLAALLAEAPERFEVVWRVRVSAKEAVVYRFSDPTRADRARPGSRGQG